ncbi:MAG: hypothetical protein AB1411_12365 [Nitrospirota bacterium]
MQEQIERDEKRIGLNVWLTPAGESAQPVLANYTAVGVVQGLAYLDFGFIEPGALALVARAAQQGKPMPTKNLEGKLSVRVAVGLDVLQRLHQQLGQVVAGLQGQRRAVREKK